ncbi:uncharacterized protein BDZ99DRAFT_387166 [Mytilinidion resinicola]|uniref:Uncharacterized protein n=1 Tax=Mytilinidion resinicola TaxID=574789 RepID=A0A6A6YPS5_9PEZI|nr:uncharacterized protein BDZ99DRAFT_387166 [Mytilinidion resinicola]KAF2810528.1 hypothetical protein BDZ99DRAFT_387166 [Mytilinidion resinicola]
MPVAGTIPLHCNICPKKPNFSDVSHLLTHIASKGHLSHYYKVKVRSSSEDASRRLIEAYDRWYSEWNVEHLMSDRMSQKDKKRTRARPSTAPQRSNRPRSGLNSLDPRLSENTIKIEDHTPTPPPMLDQASRHRSFAPRMQLWPPSRSLSRRYASPDYDDDDSISEPVGRRAYYYGLNESAIVDDDTTTVTTEESTISECTKLKGVYWPGMDIFDSATPEMRRKRNQKKDSSVLEQLEINSKEVEPTEIIFTPQGTFKKQRRISGSSFEESSPIKLEDSPKRTFIPRPVLAEMDTNRPRRTRQHTRQGTFPGAIRNNYDGASSHLDFEYGDFGQKKKSGFDVFHDQEVTFAHPAGFNYLTSEFHYTPPAPSPAFSFKPLANAFQYDNKENVDTLHHQPAFYGGGLPFPQPHFHHAPSGHDPQGLFYNSNQMSNYFNAYHPQDEEVDDERTLTAPPSPCPH